MSRNPYFSHLPTWRNRQDLAFALDSLPHILASQSISSTSFTSSPDHYHNTLLFSTRAQAMGYLIETLQSLQSEPCECDLVKGCFCSPDGAVEDHSGMAPCYVCGEWYAEQVYYRDEVTMEERQGDGRIWHEHGGSLRHHVEEARVRRWLEQVVVPPPQKQFSPLHRSKSMPFTSSPLANNSFTNTIPTTPIQPEKPMLKRSASSPASFLIPKEILDPSCRSPGFRIRSKDTPSSSICNNDSQQDISSTSSSSSSCTTSTSTSSSSFMSGFSFTSERFRMAIQQTTTEDKLSVSAKDTSSSSSSSCDSPSSPSTLDVDFSHDNKKSDSVENSNTTQTLILSSCLPADESNSGMNRTATVDQKFQESGKSIEAMEDHESPDCAKKIIFSSPEQQQQQQRQVQSNNLVQGSKVQQEQEQPPLPPRPQSSPLSEQQPRFDHNIAMSQFDFVSTNHTSLEGTSDSLIPKSLDHPIMILNGQVSVQAFLSTAMTTVTDIPWNLVTSFSSTLNPPLPPPACQSWTCASNISTSGCGCGYGCSNNNHNNKNNSDGDCFRLISGDSCTRPWEQQPWPLSTIISAFNWQKRTFDKVFNMVFQSLKFNIFHNNNNNKHKQKKTHPHPHVAYHQQQQQQQLPTLVV